jgi:hypothetical protein
MELLKSKKFRLPVIYFITDREEIKDLPIGVPFIYGCKNDKKPIIRILEYELLYQMAIESGLPFNFKDILREAGFKGLESYSFFHPTYMKYKTEGEIGDVDIIEDKHLLVETSSLFQRYIRDNAVYVNVQKLKDLKIFPVWLDTIEKAVETNIHNFAVYNENMYNKKLDGMYGALELTSPNKNLIIIDISGSIPKGVSSTCLALAKNLGETFYADLIITGSKSTLYPYEELHTLNVETIYEENEMDLVTSDERQYKTAIVFGDNHSPSHAWANKYNKNTKNISREDGKKICKWKIDKLISFHTESIVEIAGYAGWFEPKQTEKIENWVEYL